MKLRVTDEHQSGWVDTTLTTLFHAASLEIAIDERRVTAAMRPGWRYTEQGFGREEFLGAAQVSAWFTVGAEDLTGAIRGADPTLDELPPLPFPRIAIDSMIDGHPTMLLKIGADFRGEDQAQEVMSAAAMVIFEVEQGRLWDVLMPVLWADEFGPGEEVTGFGYHLTPGGHTHSYETGLWDARSQEIDNQLGHLTWKTAITAVHMLTASNVNVTRLLPARKQRRDWGRRRYFPREPRIYRVDLSSGSVRDDGGHSDREYHCRWMVRGHYRHAEGGRYLHPRTGLPATWVRAHVKGPAGAPWKGRPVHITATP